MLARREATARERGECAKSREKEGNSPGVRGKGEKRKKYRDIELSGVTLSIVNSAPFLSQYYKFNFPPDEVAARLPRDDKAPNVSLAGLRVRNWVAVRGSSRTIQLLPRYICTRSDIYSSLGYIGRKTFSRRNETGIHTGRIHARFKTHGRVSKSEYENISRALSTPPYSP